MKVLGIVSVCLVMVLIFIWLELQEEPKPIMIVLPFTEVLVVLTEKFGLKTPLIIFDVAVGAFIAFILLPAKRRKK